MYRTFPVINLQQQQPVKAMVPGTIKQQHAGGFLGKAHFLLGSSRVELVCSVELVCRSLGNCHCVLQWLLDGGSDHPTSLSVLFRSFYYIYARSASHALHASQILKI